jgi:1-acyl-sn-glycerol-3-phosphate acyltransferase
MDSRFSRGAVGAFELVFRPWMRRRIHAVRMAGLPSVDAGERPLLLAANHVSWWDGFILREVQRRMRPRAPLYTLMSTAELQRLPFFRHLGVVGIDGDSPASVRSALRTLEARLRERPDAVIAYFPQGRIWPSHRRPLGFRRGIELFVERLSPRVLPVGLHLEPLNTVAPTVFVSVGGALDAPVGADALERRVEEELDAIRDFLAEHGEDAPSRWLGVYERLPHRREGER